MKKKIVFVTPIYLPAPLYGSDNAVRILAEDFAAAGQDVTVVTSDGATPRYWYDPLFGKKMNTTKDTFNGVRVLRLPSQQWITSAAFILERVFGYLLPMSVRNKMRIVSSGPYLGGLFELLQKEQFDVVHCSPFPLEINQQVFDGIERLKKKPYVILTPFFHAEVESYHNKELGSILEKTDCIHVISNAEKKQIEALYPVSQGKTRVIPLYIRTRTMHTADALEHDVLLFKRRYGIEHRKVVLFAGLKGSMKGALTTLAAVKSLYQEDKSIVLVAIGHNTTEWNEVLKSSDTTPYLVDFGYVEESTKEIIFASCDVFCMPSKSETFGYVYLEAWHKRKPVIGCNLGPTQELIERNKGGIVVQFAREHEVEKALSLLLSDSEKRRRLGRNGYAALIKNYSEQALILSYKRLFEVKTYEKK
ncbi:MAG: glycosyltransferase family 4 protein [Patescibacteria group bacterium]